MWTRLVLWVIIAGLLWSLPLLLVKISALELPHQLSALLSPVCPRAPAGHGAVFREAFIQPAKCGVSVVSLQPGQEGDLAM